MLERTFLCVIKQKRREKGKRSKERRRIQLQDVQANLTLGIKGKQMSLGALHHLAPLTKCKPEECNTHS